jgi:hypothetical protein
MLKTARFSEPYGTKTSLCLVTREHYMPTKHDVSYVPVRNCPDDFTNKEGQETKRSWPILTCCSAYVINRQIISHSLY